MACELPVIGTLSGGPPSFINRKDGDPDGWLVPPDDEAALAAALIKAVNNPEERRQRGRSALESVRAGYSWEQVAGQVRDIYDDLLKNS
jgi:glycosyltransferase involved in cell wall biosynthesis